jgi:hypothetical protein
VGIQISDMGTLQWITLLLVVVGRSINQIRRSILFVRTTYKGITFSSKGAFNCRGNDIHYGLLIRDFAPQPADGKRCDRDQGYCGEEDNQITTPTSLQRPVGSQEVGKTRSRPMKAFHSTILSLAIYGSNIC